MRPSSYKVNSTGIKWIAHHLKGKEEEQRHEKQVWVPGLEEFLAEAESETSVAVCPCSVEVGSEPAQKVTATAILEEEEDEEEEENPDIHFKQKPMSLPPGASPWKKKKTVKPSSQHCWTLQIREVEAPTVHVPPPTPPVIEPLVCEALRESVPVIGKIISFYFIHSLL